MKSIVTAAVIGLVFFASCGSDTKPETDQSQPAASQNEKFILKAPNSQFLAITPLGTLVPNQVDPTKATVFEKVDLGNGKCALKASNGKYVTDDRSKNSVLHVDREKNGEWETFEIIAVDPSHVQIKAASGMFVCSDASKGDTLIANRPTAGAWETFDLQKQN